MCMYYDIPLHENRTINVDISGTGNNIKQAFLFDSAVPNTREMQQVIKNTEETYNSSYEDKIFPLKGIH